MRELSLDDLNAAAKIGGPSTLSEKTMLEPAAGTEGIVAPAKYLDGTSSTYVFEDRFIDGQAKKTVLIDSRTSQNNRLEDYISKAIKDGHPVFANMPRIQVTYQSDDGTGTIQPERYLDVDLPHRAFDAHIRIGSVDGTPTSQLPEYIKARNSTLADMRAIFDLSPITVAMGAWDSTRNKNQLRIASSFNGEIIGVLANQEDGKPVYRAGARVDPMAASMKFNKDEAQQIENKIHDDLTDKTSKKFTKDGNGSTIGLGAIPPTAGRSSSLDGIAVSNIIRTHVLSFSTLRSMSFGAGKEGDEAIRALLAAMLLDAMAGSNTELNLRANCILRESAKPVTILDKRFGEQEELEMLSLQHADELLEQAYQQAHEKAKVDWNGQILNVDGNELVPNRASDKDSDND
ncbi:type I-U CRISPR-associated RAMP protein Csb1/Cas7u [Bifidobacterium sp. ESL0690]|uniref:type I-G CRISPR-associated RAMP protein Csb1/Cas7g n=1 Tax=Bifidobacterium sp. ESL0690 TaxID=2983214 RepID=UPI0023F7700E|nr:type I-U CRISPR-associated RAMP protein Csb1/Cas7u [Bifidobacterium sp. ESL0690]WEV46102.1 type I-U CRISPR-associated RAMP protein Csb1/Cas7u [Bifidobacterium sp. ESL0690]